MSRMKQRAALALAPVLLLSPLAAGAVEIVNSHLFFDKSQKMKRVEASLFMSFADPTGTIAGASAERSVWCRALARGKKGVVATSGEFRLRLEGERGGGAEAWTSQAVAVAADDGGNGRFEAGDLSALIAAAAEAGAEGKRYRVDFRGGRGGRVSELSMDCLQAEEGE